MPKLARRGLEHAQAFGHDFLADAVAGHDGDAMRCHRRPLSSRRIASRHHDVADWRTHRARRLDRRRSPLVGATIVPASSSRPPDDRHARAPLLDRRRIAATTSTPPSPAASSQLNHGKAARSSACATGDGFAFYSPRAVVPGRRAAAGVHRDRPRRRRRRSTRSTMPAASRRFPARRRVPRRDAPRRSSR